MDELMVSSFLRKRKSISTEALCRHGHESSLARGRPQAP
ncbi:hypothetical protein LLB_1234 [Legionella longbeachae D-4968]|nr:hypothetical protein LLB_1234 [Legionella longbeachae D-4968]